MAVWRCTFTFRNTRLGLFSQNVVHMEDSSNIKTPQQIGSTLDSNWWGLGGTGGLRAMTSTSYKLLNISLQRIDTTPQGGSVPFISQGATGAVQATEVHPTVGFIFTLLDGGAGPRHRGRVYHSGTPTGYLFDGTPSATANATWTTLRDDWLNRFGPLPTTGLNWVIWHRDQQGDARWTRVIDIRLAPFGRCQRRRNFGVGF
jgi:hypothetical protein